MVKFFELPLFGRPVTSVDLSYVEACEENRCNKKEIARRIKIKADATLLVTNTYLYALICYVISSPSLIKSAVPLRRNVTLTEIQRNLHIEY
jgi:hypothetical protein